MTSRLTRAAALILVCCAMTGAALFFYTSNRAPDDAYISLRYADNLAQGHGLRFNPGGEKVEGFSSPLHVLAMGSALAMGAPPSGVSQASSLLGAVLCAGLVVWWGQRRLGFWWGLAAGLAVALNPSLGFWARGGLETTLFTALVLLVLILAAEGRWKSLAVAAGLMTMTRPEGFLYWAALGLFILAVYRKRWREFRVPALITFAVAAPWLLFRIFYFRDILPNTYYAKMDGVRSAQTLRGLEYLGDFLARGEIHMPLISAAVCLAVLWFFRRRARDPWPAWPAAAVCLIGATVTFALLAGGDHMNHFRFLIPALPPLMLLTAWVLSRAVALVPRGPWRAVAGIFLGLVFLSQPVRIASHDLRHPTFPLDRPIGLVEPLDDWPTCRFLKLGAALKELLPPEAVIAVIPAGAVPYASGLTTIDMLGLNDRLIAKQPGESMGTGRMGHEKGNGKLVLDRKPDVIMMRNLVNPVPGTAAEPDSTDFNYIPIRDIWKMESFHRDYEPFVVRVDDEAAYTLHRRRASADLTD